MPQPFALSRTALRWRWLIWAVYLSLWTTGLVIPIPGDTFLEFQVVHISLKLLVAKSLHVLAYAALTILSGRLLIAPRFRWAMMFFLMFHGCLTEMIQLHLSYRSGLLMDVMFDNLGVALGVACSWKYWTAPDSVILTEKTVRQSEAEGMPWSPPPAPPQESTSERVVPK